MLPLPAWQEALARAGGQVALRRQLPPPELAPGPASGLGSTARETS